MRTTCIAVAVAVLIGTASALNTTTLTVRCTLPAGPVFAATHERPIPGPGYGHKGYNHTEDVFFILSDNVPSAAHLAPHARFVDHRVAGSANATAVNSIVLGVARYNCSVVWVFHAGATVVQPPMHDGQLVVFQTYDAAHQLATAYVVNATSGATKWVRSVGSLAFDGAISTAVHDGRIFLSYITSAAEFTLSCYHAETARLLWSATDGEWVPNATATTRLWLSYNVRADLGFFNLGNAVTAFHGPTGNVVWTATLNGPAASMHSTSATATEGWIPHAHASATASSQLQWGAPAPQFLFVVAKDAAGMLTDTLVALNQTTGAVAWTQRVANVSHKMFGRASTNKYTTGVFVLVDNRVVRYNKTNGVHVYTSADAVYHATPSPAFHDTDLVFASAAVGAPMALQGLNATTGAVAWRHTMFNGTRAVFGGYPGEFESTWDVAALAAADRRGAHGEFAILHVGTA